VFLVDRIKFDGNIHGALNRAAKWIPIQLAISWIAILGGMAVYLLFDNHIGLAVSLLTVMAVTAYSQRSKDSRSPVAHLLTWGANLAAVCFVLGFLNGSSFKYRPFERVLEHLPVINSVYNYINRSRSSIYIISS
jgi:hypothetical protein